MRRHCLPVILAVTMCVAVRAQSQIPSHISYQAYVTDTSGKPVPNGLYEMRFSVYTVDSGGVPIWTELHPSVPVNGGLCNVILGKGNPSNPFTLLFDIPYFLGVKLETDPEMKPRIPLTSVAYSFRSRFAEGVARGAITDTNIAQNANISITKLNTTLLTESEIAAGSGITISKSAGILTISVNPAVFVLAGDVTGPPNANVIASNAVTTGKIADLAVTASKIAAGAVTTPKLADNSVTLAKIQPDILTSLDGVTNDGGDIDLVAGSNISITPNDAANTITITSTAPVFSLPYSGTVSSASTAFDVENTGAGKAGYVHVTNAGSNVEAMKVATTSNNASGDALNATAQAGNAVDAASSGTEPTIVANNTNGSGTAPVIRGLSGGVNVFNVDQAGDVTAAGDVSADSHTASTNIGTAGNPVIGRYYKDNAVYAWAHINQAGVMLSGFGCTSVRIGVGTYQINYKLTFNSNEYAPMAIVQHPVGIVVAVISASAGNNCVVKLWVWTGANFQEYDAEFFFHLTGRQ